MFRNIYMGRGGGSRQLRLPLDLPMENVIWKWYHEHANFFHKEIPFLAQTIKIFTKLYLGEKLLPHISGMLRTFPSL